MKIRVLLVVVTIAAALHALVFVALGRIGGGKPVRLVAPAAAKPAVNEQAAAPAPSRASAPATSAIAIAPRAAQSRKTSKHAPRSRRDAAHKSALPVFDLAATPESEVVEPPSP